MRSWCSALFGLLWLVASAAHADVGSAWLRAQAAPDGAIATSRDIANPYQTTKEAVETLIAFDEAGAAEIAAAVRFLDTDAFADTEYLARRAIVAVLRGEDSTPYYVGLLQHRNADGGFGDQPGYPSNLSATAFALEALAHVPARYVAERDAASAWVASMQAADGSWQLEPDHAERVILTARLARGLPSASAARARAGEFLIGARLPATGLWSSLHASIQALLTLAPRALDDPSVAQSLTALRQVQATDGSWASDAYLTALALRAFRVAEQGPVVPPEQIVVTGLVVDAVTGSALVGAGVAGGDPAVQATTGSDGRFRWTGTNAAGLSLTITRDGYSDTVVVVDGSGGLTIDVGTVRLQPLVEGAQDLDVTLRIVDAVDGSPIAGAAVVRVGAGEAATTDAAGLARFQDLAGLEHAFTIVASGYVDRNVTVEATTFGSILVNASLQREPSTATVSTLRGRVVDTAGTKLSGVLVSLGGAGAATTDANGDYEIRDVASLVVNLEFERSGYHSESRDVVLPTHGAYRFDATLVPVTSSTLVVRSFVASSSTIEPGQNLRFDASIENTGTGAVDAEIGVRIETPAGAPIATVRGLTDGAAPLVATIGARKTVQWQADWSALNLAQGTYRARFFASRPGTRRGEAPMGIVLAQATVDLVAPARARIAGILSPNPPALTADSPGGVRLSALVQNLGNVALAEQDYRLDVLGPSGATVESFTATGPTIGVNRFVGVDFGTWRPAAEGDYTLRVRAVDASVAGELLEPLPVGAVATATFTVDPALVPEGTSSVSGHVTVDGVDLPSGAESDPLYGLVQAAITRASERLDDEALQWSNGFCLGCHVESQTLFGLGNSLDKGDVDVAKTRRLYDAIRMARQSSGAIYNSNGVNAQTQTMLSAWALRGWPDRENSFGTRHDAAEFLHGKIKTDTSGRKYWQPDHAGAWWSKTLPLTAFIGATLADTLTDATELGVEAVEQIEVRNGGALSSGESTRDLASRADGKLFALGSRGRIYQLNYATIPFGKTDLGILLPTSASAFKARDDGSFVVAAGTQLLRVAPGEPNVVLATATSAIRDVAVHASGRIFVLLDAKLTELVGGALQTVYDQADVKTWGQIVAAPEGDLVVTYRAAGTRKRLVRFDPNTLAAREDTRYLPIDPEDVAYAPNGTMYVAHFDYFSLPVDPAQVAAGVLRFRPDGDATRLPTVQLGEDLAVAGSYVFAIRSGAPQRIQARLVAPDLSAIKADVPAMVRWLLNGLAESDDRVFDQALRSMALTKLAPHVTDATLKAQATAMAAEIDARLLAAQHSDGGWRSTFGADSAVPSDVFVTAWVGLVLDHLEPSTDTPWLRNAVSFLLAKQGSDGTWPASVYFSRPFASTGGVMAFLPLAFERLGGVDATLEIDFPADVRLLDASVAPDVVDDRADGTARRAWNLAELGPNSLDIDLGLSVVDVALGEVRPVADAAFIAYRNAFNGDLVRIQLAIPTVANVNALSVGLQLDRVDYGAEEPVILQGTAINAGAASEAGLLRFSIETTDGVVLATLPDEPFADLPANSQTHRFSSWSTGATRPGTYVARVRLLDLQGHERDQETATFHVVSDGAQAAAILDVTTDHAEYGIDDRVALAALGRSLSRNVTVGDSAVTLVVRDPANAVIWSQTFEARELSPLATQRFAATLPLARAVPGTYRVEGSLSSATYGVLGGDVATFAVVNRLETALDGGVAVERAALFAGMPQSCRYDIRNDSPFAVSAVELRHLLVRQAGSVIVDAQTTQLASLAGGAKEDWTRTYGSASLAVGGYFCALQVRIDGTWQTFDVATFDVEPAPLLDLRTDRAVYHISDSVGIAATADNTRSGVAVPDASVQFVVEGPDGNVVWSGATAPQALAAGDTQPWSSEFALASAAPGRYRLRGTLAGPAFGPLAAAQATFDVVNMPDRALTGSVDAASSVLALGEPQQCTYAIRNATAHALTDVVIRQRVVRADTGAALAEHLETVASLAASSAQSWLRHYATDAFPATRLECVLEVSSGTGWQLLARDGFDVLPVRLEASLRVGAVGRILILLDPLGAAGATAAEDPLGPSSAPGLGAQRAHLEALLARAGWSYTIVESRDDFRRELRSGGYAVYAIFAEHEKLATKTQEELREAVFRGEGLLGAGEHDARDAKLFAAFGVDYRGRRQDARAVSFVQRALSEAGAANLLDGESALRFALAGAIGQARYLDGSGSEVGDAVALHTFGAGRAAYYGFDLLAAATRDGPSALLSDAMLDTLGVVQPDTLPVGTAHVVPITVELRNLGVEARARVELPLPVGVTVVDAGGAQLQGGSLVWNVTVDAESTELLTVWVRLPATAGPREFSARVEAGTASATVLTTIEVRLAVEVTAPESLASLAAALVQLEGAPGAPQGFKQARIALERASGDLAAGRYEQAMDQAIIATDHLAGVSGQNARDVRARIGVWMRWLGMRMTGVQP